MEEKNKFILEDVKPPSKNELNELHLKSRDKIRKRQILGNWLQGGAALIIILSVLIYLDGNMLVQHEAVWWMMVALSISVALVVFCGVIPDADGGWYRKKTRKIIETVITLSGVMMTALLVTQLQALLGSIAAPIAMIAAPITVSFVGAFVICDTLIYKPIETQKLTLELSEEVDDAADAKARNIAKLDATINDYVSRVSERRLTTIECKAIQDKLDPIPS